MDNSTSQQTGGRILVIDDDRNILQIIELYLKKAGFDVVTCADGLQAVGVYKDKRPDLVVDLVVDSVVDSVVDLVVDLVVDSVVDAVVAGTFFLLYLLVTQPV